MASTNRPLVRLAATIHAELSAQRGREPLVDLPSSGWQRCVDLVRQARRARLHGWHLAERELLKDLSYTIPSVERELSMLAQRVPRSASFDHRVTAHDIYQDLVALRQEFDQLDYDLRERWLAVVTEPIVLAGIDLGPFEIRLQWGRPARDEIFGYRVIARDPHPAESRDNVTHPHVMDKILCEGEGRHTIRQALSQGRLLDFFMVVVGILRTYNSESPYVELALWQGGSCADCGTAIGEGERYTCQKCDVTVCGECDSACCGCDDSCCSDCTGSCTTCADNYCQRCLKPCNGCRARVCAGCLENERCPNCHEQEFSEGEGENDVAAPDGAAVQSHGLGQAVVPA